MLLFAVDRVLVWFDSRLAKAFFGIRVSVELFLLVGKVGAVFVSNNRKAKKENKQIEKPKSREAEKRRNRKTKKQKSKKKKVNTEKIEKMKQREKQLHIKTVNKNTVPNI
jgi:hypothetical protein